MAPPFIAYFGAYDQAGNMTWLLQAAYDQCRLYRNYLQDSTTKLWKHIELGSGEDENFWATGNGWAAAGMLRVHQQNVQQVRGGTRRYAVARGGTRAILHQFGYLHPEFEAFFFDMVREGTRRYAKVLVAGKHRSSRLVLIFKHSVRSYVE